MKAVIALLGFWIVGGGPATSNFNTAYNRAFLESYRAGALRSCQSTIKAAYPNDKNATDYCLCVVDKLLQTKSVSELSKKPTLEELKPIGAACYKAHPSTK
jgi:hypothetical protein